MELDDWQQWCLAEALSEASDGQWSAFEVAILVGRQCGKGAVLEARQLAGLFLVHERLQVHTAHEFKTCFEHFLRVVALIEGTPDLDSRVARIRRGAGEQAIELKTGERLRFLARSSGSGRGMAGDVVYLDEAFALTPQMMGALLPTLSARPNPQVWYTSSAPMSTSVVLHDVRKRGHDDGRSPRLFLAEWGNERGVDIEDRDAWYRANPALGIRISEEFIEAELTALRSMPDEFARERLGVPDLLPDDTEARDVKLPADRWAATVTGDVALGSVTLGFAASPDGEFASVAIAGGSQTAPYVELIAHHHRTGWVADLVVKFCAANEVSAIGYYAAGPSRAVSDGVRLALSEAKVTVPLEFLSTAAYKAACGAFYNDVVDGRMRRPDVLQGPLDVAAADATERTLGDTWMWDARNSTVPICPLEAATVARALLPVEAPPEPVRRSPMVVRR